MSLKLIKLLQIVLLVCLLFSLYQGFNLGYQLLAQNTAVEAVNFNLKELEQDLATIAAGESKHQFVVRKNNWQEIETDKLFPIKKQVKDKPKKQQVESQTNKSQEEEKKKFIAELKTEVPFVVVATSVFTKQGINKAVVAAKEGEETYIIQPGQKIKGYQITAIKANKLLLEINGRSITLNLNENEGR